MVQFCTPAEVAATGYSGTQGTLPINEAVCQKASAVVLEAVRNDLLDPAFVITTNWDDITATAKHFYGYGERLVLAPFQAGSVASVVDASNVVVNPATYTVADWSLIKVGDPWAVAADSWNGRYSITAKWGALLPDSLKEVVIELAVNIHRSARSGQFTDQLGVNDGGKIALFGRLDSLQKAVIESFVQLIRRNARYE